MNRTGLYTLTSGLHSEVMPDASEERFIREIAAAGADFDFCGEDFSRYGSHDAELSQRVERESIRPDLYARTREHY